MEEDDTYDDVNVIYGNHETILFDELIKSGRVLGDDNDENSDFSSDDEEEDENAKRGMQPQHNNKLQDCYPPVRPPLPIPRNQQEQKQAKPFADDVECIYLQPIDPSLINAMTKGPPIMHSPTHHSPNSSQKVPWIATRGNGDPTSFDKTSTAPPIPAFPRSKLCNRPSLPGNNSQSFASENGRSGAAGGPFLHPRLLDQRPNTLPKTTKAPAWMPPLCTQENIDHVYEPVGKPPLSPLLSAESSDRLLTTRPPMPIPAVRNHHHKDFEQDLNGRLGAATLSSKQQVPLSSAPLNKARGRNDNFVKQHSKLGLSSHRPPLPLPGVNQPAPEKVPAPQESAPYPKESPIQYVNLDDGKRVILTPLYQEIYEKPYFHLISRAKAKMLLMNDSDGSYVIRPSTRTEHPLTLTLKNDGSCYNINIRHRHDCLFALGNEKLQEQTFSSLDELVQTYNRDPIKLVNGKWAYLKHTPAKEGSIYVKYVPSQPGKY